MRLVHKLQFYIIENLKVNVKNYVIKNHSWGENIKKTLKNLLQNLELDYNFLVMIDTYINYDIIIRNKYFSYFKGLSASNSYILNNNFEIYELKKTLSQIQIGKAMGPLIKFIIYF